MPSRVERDALAAVVASVRDPAGTQVTARAEAAWAGQHDGHSRIAALAECHGVVGWVLRTADRRGLELPPLRQAAASAAARHLRAVGDLGACVRVLERSEIDFVVAKGPALSTLVHRDPGLRAYVDLDIAVDRPDFPGALAALESAGFTLLDRNWTLLGEVQAQELRLLSPSLGVVDLHSSLGRGPAGRDTAPSVRTLRRRGRVLGVAPGVQAWTLNEVDTVVHLAVHAADAGGHRLLWLADLRAAWLRAQESGATADTLVQAAREWGAAPALAIMLDRAARVLGADVPPVAERPGAWSVVRAVERRRCPLSSGRAGTVARLVARSARETPHRSARAAAGKGVAWVLSGGRPPVSPTEAHDEENPRSSAHPSGEREQFLAALVATVRPGEVRG